MLSMLIFICPFPRPFNVLFAYFLRMSVVHLMPCHFVLTLHRYSRYL